MALRDFVDSNGTPWKVWDVTAEALRPITRAEDFLREFSAGWLCFESAHEKRRLIGYPEDWATRSGAELEELLRASSPTISRQEDESSGEFERREETLHYVERLERRSGDPGPPGHPLRRRGDLAP